MRFFHFSQVFHYTSQSWVLWGGWDVTTVVELAHMADATLGGVLIRVPFIS